MCQFVIPGDTISKMFHHMFLHVACNYRPDATVACPHLRNLFDCIGLKLFSVDTFRRNMMPKEVEKVQVCFTLIQQQHHAELPLEHAQMFQPERSRGGLCTARWCPLSTRCPMLFTPSLSTA
jgi:hypothetical protein